MYPSRHRRSGSVLTGSLLLVAICGCPPAQVPGGGSTVADADRLVSLQQAQAAIDAIGLDGDPTKTDQIVAALQALPDFDRVEAGDGVVYAHFTDGEGLIVMNNRPAVDPDAAATQTKPINREAQRTQAARPVPGASKPSDGVRSDTLAAAKSNRIPESKHAVLVNTMGTDYCDLTGQIGGWLSDAGYGVSVLDGSLESLRTGVTDVGVMYYNGHGSSVPDWLLPAGLTPLLPGFKHFALWTKTPVTDANLGTYRAEVALGLLTYAVCPTDRIAGNLEDCLDHKDSQAKSELHYVITEYFVNQYWRCRPGALIYFDACHVGEATSPLPEVCLMPDVNASAVVAWTGAVLDPWSTPTVLFLFDRMLGSNDYPPSHSPPQRPFTLNATLAAMKDLTRLGLPLDESKSYKGFYRVETITVADLVAVYADDTLDLVLRPAIQQLTVHEGSNRLVLDGDFGDTPGTVALNGADLALSGDGWGAQRIECDVPQDASGQVVVTAGERTSNLRRLTQWRLTFQQLFMDYPTQQATNCPDCFYEATIHYTIRADVGGTRAVAEGEVTPPSFAGPASDGDIEVTNAGGSYSIGQGSTITLAPNADDGAAFIGTCIGFAPPADNNFLGACFHLDGAQYLITFSPTIFAEGLFRDYTGGVFDGIIDPYQVSYSGNIVGNELLLSLSPNFNILAGQQATGPNSYFQWSSADAVSPALPDDPR